VFTPSSPANVTFSEKYRHGILVLERMGFKVVEGPLTASGRSQGYRSGSPKERADEFMTLIRDPKIKGLISTIGGANSSSLIPFLDFDLIRATPKVICGYSDVTSLHLAILAYAGLSTFYGPAVMPSFGEWPDIQEDTKASFLQAVQTHVKGSRLFTPPLQWSNHFRDAKTDEWRTQARNFNKNPGWRVLNPGIAEAPIVVANLNTLMTAAGTDYFPKLDKKILLIEEMSAPLSEEERDLRHLERLGVFDVLSGLMISKPEFYNNEGAPFDYDDLILEIVGTNRSYPIISNFDCGHTVPMLTIAEMTPFSIAAKAGNDVSVRALAPMVE
jgi:muramoyltetrapeptide carboxypeptidase LdcA involved in peptidoglycan recycling